MNQAPIWVSQKAVFVSHNTGIGDLAVSPVRYKGSYLDKHYPVDERQIIQTENVLLV